MNSEVGKSGYQASKNNWLVVASALALFGLFAWYGLQSTDIGDDDIAHFLIARFSWNHPAEFLNRWGRPAFTLLYAPVALWGMSAVRILSAVLAAITCLCAGLLARLYRVRWYWLAVLLTGLQPEFLRQAFSALTELTFAFLFCAALIACKKRQWGIMAFLASLLPLARYESLVIVFVFALILFRYRRMYLISLLGLPLLFQNSFWAIREQNPANLIFPFDQLLGLKIVQTNYGYAQGDPFHYIVTLPIAYGGITFVLACYGGVRERFGILQLCVVITAAILSLTYWLIPSAGLAGLTRPLIIVAPCIGVLSAIGWEKIFETDARKLLTIVANAILTGWLWLQQMYAACALAVSIPLLNWLSHTRARLIIAVIIPAVVWSALTQVHPLGFLPEHQTITKSINWLGENEYQERLILGSDPYLAYASDIDSFNSMQIRDITLANLAQAPAGSIAVWDSHYSHRLIWNTPLESIQNDSRFRLLKSWQEDGFRLYIFEKVTE